MPLPTNTNPNSREGRESLRWYVRVVKNFMSNQKAIAEENIGKIVGAPSMGVPCHFWYDAKLKAILPHWDRFPIVIPFEPKNDGFIGLNLHYLPPVQRQVMFDSMMNIRARKNLTDDNRIMLVYGMLKETTRFPGWQLCIKRYLSGHIESPFLNINPEQWRFIVGLPTSQFVKGKPY
jgi:hypothetical protein